MRLIKVQESSSSSEPNSYQKKAGFRVDGYQLGQDFVHLRTILSKSKLYQASGLYGPDVSQPRDHRRDLLEGWVSDDRCLRAKLRNCLFKNPACSSEKLNLI